MKAYLRLSLLILFCSGQTLGQYLSESEMLSKAKQSAIGTYHAEIGYQSGLYNGNKYLGNNYFFQNNGHPFFMSKEPAKGSVVYEGVSYPNINLRYDEVIGELVFRDLSKEIQLINDHISAFTIAGHNFIKVIASDPLIKAGFYEVLHEGEHTVLKKEVKSVIEDISSASEGIKRRIKIDHLYLIKKSNEYYPVKKKKDVLVIHEFLKKETQEFIKINDLNYKKDRDVFLIKVCELYDQQTPGNEI